MPVALPVLFGAGLLTSLTPCVYPMIPITAGILGGAGAATRSRRTTALYPGLYVLGLALVYALLGLIAGLTGTLFGTISANPWAYATFGTLLGFVFAFAIVRCKMPGRGLVHLLALVPTVSPPLAIALATILLAGRSGLITKRLLGIEFQPGMNDVYGMDGLVFVQVITFFSVSYLILRAMLERLDASMEEAAASLGAGRFTIFRTVTLPLLIPGIAGAFLLLFVEALADLGNPQLHARQDARPAAPDRRDLHLLAILDVAAPRAAILLLDLLRRVERRA